VNQLTANQNRARRMTLIFAVACAMLLAVGWYIATNMRSGEPTTLDGVSREVLAGIDDIQSSLPASAIVSSSDQTDVSACPDGGGGRQFTIDRTITVAEDFDETRWMGTLVARYQARDRWNVTLQKVGRVDKLDITIVGPPLIIYRVTNNSTSRGPQVLISSESRCTVPAAN
jgi:hypothetical protein